MSETTTRDYYTMARIRAENAAAGRHWFEAGATRFFLTRYPKRAYQGPGGVYFVTSEQFVGSDHVAAPRKYTVRTFSPETKHIDTVGEFNELTRSEATSQAKALAKGAA